MFDPQIPLVVTNIDEVPVTIGWNNVFTTIKPGESKTCQVDAVFNFFGDPRCIQTMQTLKSESGIVSWVSDRATEVRRLQCKWGNTFAENENYVRAPKVEVRTLDGDRIYTVVEDPEGRQAMPEFFAAQDASNDVNSQIARMQRQLDQLLRLREAGEELPDVTPEEELPTDENPSPRRGGRVLARGASDE